MTVEIQHFKNKFHPRTTLKNICTVQNFLIFGLTHTELTLPYADCVLALLQHQLQLLWCTHWWVLEGEKKTCGDVNYWYCSMDLEFHCRKEYIRNEQKTEINGEIQLRQQLNVFSPESFCQVLIVSLVYFPTAYDIHTLLLLICLLGIQKMHK